MDIAIYYLGWIIPYIVYPVDRLLGAGGRPGSSAHYYIALEWGWMTELLDY